MSNQHIDTWNTTLYKIGNRSFSIGFLPTHYGICVRNHYKYPLLLNSIGYCEFCYIACVDEWLNKKSDMRNDLRFMRARL